VYESPIRQTNGSSRLNASNFKKDIGSGFDSTKVRILPLEPFAVDHSWLPQSRSHPEKKARRPVSRLRKITASLAFLVFEPDEHDDLHQLSP
jgi:hypothetical protein